MEWSPPHLLQGTLLQKEKTIYLFMRISVEKVQWPDSAIYTIIRYVLISKHFVSRITEFLYLQKSLLWYLDMLHCYETCYKFLKRKFSTEIGTLSSRHCKTVSENIHVLARLFCMSGAHLLVQLCLSDPGSRFTVNNYPQNYVNTLGLVFLNISSECVWGRG